MKQILLFFTVLGVNLAILGQKMPVSYDFGEKLNDRYRYSNLVTIDDDGDGGYIMVRAYFQGLILKPKGYIIEHYNKDLELVSEYNYKLRGLQFVDGFIKNGQLRLIFFNYNFERGFYEYQAHTSNLVNFDFKREQLLKFVTPAVEGAFGKNYYNRDFKKGFSTTLLFNPEKSGFIISTHHRKGKENKHTIHLFDSDLNKRWENDFSAEVEEKNYAFENIALSNNGDEVYILGKAYFKKNRFKAEERKFQYELIKIGGGVAKTQSFDNPGKFSEGLYPILNYNKLYCVGFYADRKDNRYNGLSFFELNPSSLAILNKKYNPFTQQFMDDKFGRDDEQVINNLVFKNVVLTDENTILFNAEEYFVTTSMQSTGAGQRVRVERFHYNDIVSAKMDTNGRMIWARNINKAEVTQGDGAYTSYSSYTKDGDTYFFISTAAENPQLINGERLVFKQGLTGNRNVFLISLDEIGKLDYEKVIDAKDARLPLMVSKPLIDVNEDELLFYAKRGTKKQLVKVEFN
ncbi:hypothetical protein [Croceitalea rosinachiae]|uniref:6-bladed beta-propeller protein n=1 Tax=Croceitalea rosinachiae TaxID=3075596 RepID=A0ABU3A7E5_9FLAO|nr:hypothetical protein [Croceitalea sp. F388]MDT0606081.1 hypothetical protein [Croceitalea sp. F388]